MLNVLEKEGLRENAVRLSDGREMNLEDLRNDYEILLNEENFRKARIPTIKNCETFIIDRKMIEENKAEILDRTYKEGANYLAKKFLYANKEANKDLKKYPRLIHTHISISSCLGYNSLNKFLAPYKERLCNEIICYLELEMRVLNGESPKALQSEPNYLGYKRLIKFTNEAKGYGIFGHPFGASIDRVHNFITHPEIVWDYEKTEYKTVDYSCMEFSAYPYTFYLPEQETRSIIVWD